MGTISVPVPAIVNPLKVFDPVTVWLFPVNVIVEVPAVNVPLLLQLPPIFKFSVPDKTTGARAFTVIVPVTVLVATSVHVFVPAFVIVRLL